MAHGKRATMTPEEEIQVMRKALIPFARIWAMNVQLNPDLSSGVGSYIAEVWPTMADAKSAYDLVWQYRRRGE